MAAKRRSIVTGERPERPAYHGEAADCSDEGRDERDNEEADGRCIRASGLTVDQGEWEDGVGGEDGVEIRDGVEDCDEVAETGEERCDILGQDRLGDIDAWSERRLSRRLRVRMCWMVSRVRELPT